MKIAVVDDRLALPETRDHRLFMELYAFDDVEYLFFTGKDSSTGKYSPQAVLDFLRENNPDALLLDLAFGTDWEMGFSVLEQLKKDELKIPTAMITNSGCDEMKEKCRGYGIDCFLDPKYGMDSSIFHKELCELSNMQLAVEMTPCLVDGFY